MTRLDDLLLSIDPGKTLEETRRRADEALDSFDSPKGMIENWEEFRDFMARLHCHLTGAILRAKSPLALNLEMDWHGCRQILKRAYGLSGDKAAFEMARTGNQGGLYAVMKTLAQGLAEELADTEIRAHIAAYLNGLTSEEEIDATEEYVAKHGSLLPSEITEKSAIRVKCSFAEVLQQHPRLLAKTRRVGW